MSSNKLFSPTNRVQLLLCGALLVTLTGCVGYVNGPRAGVYVAPPVVAVEDDYVYYPDYEIYYSSSRRQYAYREGNAWVSRPAPRGVSVDVLRSSRSVNMDFHDSPANHHAAVVQKYPKQSSSSGSNQGRNDKRNGGQRAQQGDNHGGNDGR